MLKKVLNKKMVIASIGLLIIIFLAQAFPYNQARYSCTEQTADPDFVDKRNIIIEKYLINPFLFNMDFFKIKYWYKDIFNVVTLQKQESCRYNEYSDIVSCDDSIFEMSHWFNFGLNKYEIVTGNIEKGFYSKTYKCTPYENSF